LFLDLRISVMKIEVNITNEPTNEPRSFSLNMESNQYSEVKLYIPKVNGKPSVASGKRWYVWFLWRNPETKNLDMKFKFYRKLNLKKTVRERKILGKAMVKAYEILLAEGWNPTTEDKGFKKNKRKNKVFTLRSGLEYALELKARNLKEATKIDYNHRLEVFLNWAQKNLKDELELRKFTLDDFYEFMDHLEFEATNKRTGEKLSNTSIENTKRVISALFTELKNKRLIDHNFIKDIPKLKSKPVKNKPFSHSQIQEIKKYLKKNDPYLIQFISFMIYPLLRPREILRLKIRDLNTVDWIIGVETKTEAYSYSRIIDKMKPIVEEMNIEILPGNYNLFSYKDRPDEWDTNTISSKVNYFSKRFKKVKDALGYGAEYGLYSFRHSAIGDLYNSLQDSGLSEKEILYKLMPITGHKSEAGIKNYLRNIKVALPPDHSNIYTINF
jgi:integrase